MAAPIPLGRPNRATVSVRALLPSRSPRSRRVGRGGAGDRGQMSRGSGDLLAAHAQAPVGGTCTSSRGAARRRARGSSARRPRGRHGRRALGCRHGGASRGGLVIGAGSARTRPGSSVPPRPTRSRGQSSCHAAAAGRVAGHLGGRDRQREGEGVAPVRRVLICTMSLPDASCFGVGVAVTHSPRRQRPVRPRGWVSGPRRSARRRGTGQKWCASRHCAYAGDPRNVGVVGDRVHCAAARIPGLDAAVQLHAAASVLPR